MFNMETKLGYIDFSQDIINKIVAEAVEGCNGKAEIFHYRGKLKQVMPGLASKMNLYDEEAGSIQIEETDEGVIITVYLVLRFGVSIKKTTSEIIDRIYDDVEKIFGEKPKKVTIIVTGTLSKNIVKRHIEVSR